jgi:hypothetical protein
MRQFILAAACIAIAAATFASLGMAAHAPDIAYQTLATP